jgi:hypothetical protein
MCDGDDALPAKLAERTFAKCKHSSPRSMRFPQIERYERRTEIAVPFRFAQS